MYGPRAIADDHKLLEDLLGRICHPIVIAESHLQLIDRRQ
jgi:hypothetical protein